MCNKYFASLITVWIINLAYVFWVIIYHLRIHVCFQTNKTFRFYHHLLLPRKKANSNSQFFWCRSLFVTFQAKTSTQPFYRGKYRDLPGSLLGFTGKFTGMYRKVFWDMAFTSLGSLGNPGKSRWAYRVSSRFTRISRWAPRYFTGEWPVNFQFPGKSVLVFAWNVTFLEVFINITTDKSPVEYLIRTNLF